MKDKIKTILKENIDELEGIEITNDLELITGGYIDSFDIINIITALEEEFDICISLDDLDIMQFDTVDSIEQLITETKKKGMEE